MKARLLPLVALVGLLSACSDPADSTFDGGSEDADAYPGPSCDEAGQPWSVLHGNPARTDSVATCGVPTDPVVLFDYRSAEPSAFSGPVIGPVDEEIYGAPYLLYRTLGPGPSAIHPPPGIDVVFGSLARVEARHPWTGDLIRYEDLNPGAFTNFAAVDSSGDVWIGDTGRLHHFSAGLEQRLHLIDLTGYVGEGLMVATTAGTPLFLSDGNVLLPFLGGLILLIDRSTGQVVDQLDMTALDPPVAPDPQHGWAGTHFRNAVAADGDLQFYLVHGEILRVLYEPEQQALRLVERMSYEGFSSSTPTLDLERKRLFVVTLDPADESRPPLLICFDYDQVPMRKRWEVETSIAFLESEDQLTNTFIASLGIILNNALYGTIEAYRETADGLSAELLWSTEDTVGPDMMAYIASVSERDRTVYVHDNLAYKLYALDAETGVIRWSLDVPGQSVKTPIPFDSIVYFDHLWGLLAVTTSDRWNRLQRTP